MRDEFVYPNPSPELTNYLKLCKSNNRDDFDRAQRSAARNAILKAELLDYHRAQVAWACQSEHVGPPQVHASPSEKYSLVITTHSNGKGYFEYTKGAVSLMGGDTITTVCRNYGRFPFLFVEGCPNGHDYLVCGEDYQGQTIIELDTGRRRDYLPDSANAGSGFCWADITVSASKRTLGVTGCFWGGGYEIWLIDFSNPMECLPALERKEELDTFSGWSESEPDTCYISLEQNFVLFCQKFEMEMTAAEFEEYSRRVQEAGEEETLSETRTTRSTPWTRQAPTPTAEAFIRYLIKYWGPPRVCPLDFVENAKQLIRLAPEADHTMLNELLGGKEP